MAQKIDTRVLTWETVRQIIIRGKDLYKDYLFTCLFTICDKKEIKIS